MKANQADHAVRLMCRLLDVSASGYYAWLGRRPSRRAEASRQLAASINEVHVESRGTYGAPRIQAELRARGLSVSKKRIARSMRMQGIQGISRRRRFRTTVRSKEQRPSPDLVQRNFVADAPNKLWVADITYVPTLACFTFLAVVLDVFSRRIIGWAMAPHLRTELVLQALDMAVKRRQPTNVIHHSDQGCQYTSIAFGQRCREAGVRPSMGSVGDAYDNAMCESFFATLECELLDRRRFVAPHEAHPAVFDFIEGFYNSKRRHSALGYESPIDYEKKHAVAN